jgi:peptide/nickel transport system substrate-binding protein
MAHKRRTRLIGVVAGLVALSVIATATAASRQASSSTLTIVQFADPDTIDPAVANDGVAGKVVQNLYDRLVRVSPDNKRILPSLATRWTVSKNGLTYTFFLRRGVRFHDGSPFNAEAVRYSFERMIGIGKSDAQKYKGRLSPRNIRVLDDYTVRFRLTKPYAGFLNLLGYFSGGSIVSPSWVKENATQADPWAEKYMLDHANGTGAFKLNTWQRKQYIQLDRNDAYWRSPAKVARVVYKTLSDPAAARLQLERGDIDVITNISTDTYNALARNPNIRVRAYPVLDNVFWVFNNQAEPFDDVRVRQALSYAVDYTGIMRLVGAGGTRMTSPLQPKLKEYNPNVRRYTRNLARARALLEQAGFPDGLTIETTVVEYGDLKPISQILQANLAQIGVKLEIKEQPFGPFLEDIASGKAKMFPWVTNPPLADPDAILYPPFHSSSPKNSDGNYTRYRNPRVDALLQKAQRSSNARERERAYKQAQALIVADAPWIFLYYRNNLQGWRSNVVGYYWPLIGVPDLWGVRKS